MLLAEYEGKSLLREAAVAIPDGFLARSAGALARRGHATLEDAVAAYASRPGAKPVAALIVGREAPKGKKMGHAAALIGSHADTHPAKIQALLNAGVHATGAVTGLVAAASAALKRSNPPN